MRLKLNTAYRRLQDGFKQFIELYDCNMLYKIPDLNIEFFDEIAEFLLIDTNQRMLF
jgi:hypothetical protein